jgi:hypothetical protein
MLSTAALVGVRRASCTVWRREPFNAVALFSQDPDAAQAAGCPATITPFNGDHKAGIHAHVLVWLNQGSGIGIPFLDPVA